MEAIRALQQAIQYFSDEQSCIDYMVKMRWPDGVVICPTCGRDDVSWLKNQRKWQCKSRHSKRQFSAKVGTIFEDSPLGLDKWLMTAWMLVNCKNGISSYEIARAIGVTQKSAWFMLHRLRLAMKSDHEGKLGGEGGTVEADECFVGGKERNKHLGQRKGEDKKTIVMGMKDRDTRQIRAKVNQSDTQQQNSRPSWRQSYLTPTLIGFPQKAHIRLPCFSGQLVQCCPTPSSS